MRKHISRIADFINANTGAYVAFEGIQYPVRISYEPSGLAAFDIAEFAPFNKIGSCRYENLADAYEFVVALCKYEGVEIPADIHADFEDVMMFAG